MRDAAGGLEFVRFADVCGDGGGRVSAWERGKGMWKGKGKPREVEGAVVWCDWGGAYRLW